MTRSRQGSPFAVDSRRFPRTRYQGSKRRLAAAIVGAVRGLDFTSVLDAFGGTGAVAYAFKQADKAVTYNDILRFNHQIGTALIENDSVHLTPDDMEAIGRRRRDGNYGRVIEENFAGIYFTTEENRWLDTAVGNINRFAGPYKRALAWFAVIQAALAKRPYNLFHRANLYMRTADVQRSFGNKVSWDRSFPEHLAKFAAEANRAVFASGVPCRAIGRDVLEIEPGFDLVYIDTPYITDRGVGVAYREFYHFLEGMVQYDRWPAMIDARSRHRRLLPNADPWADPRTCHEMFRRLFERFAESILVISYRSDGIPSIDELIGLLRRVKPNVSVVRGDRCQYALSTRRDTREVLLVGTS